MPQLMLHAESHAAPGLEIDCHNGLVRRPRTPADTFRTGVPWNLPAIPAYR